MDLESIYALMERFERSSLTGLELEQNGTRLKLDRTVTAAPAASAPILAAAPPRLPLPPSSPLRRAGPSTSRPLWWVPSTPPPGRMPPPL